MIVVFLVSTGDPGQRDFGIPAERTHIGVQGCDPAAVVDLDLASGRAQDSGSLAIVDCEIVYLVLNEPAVTIPANRDTDNVAEISENPGSNSRVRRFVNHPQGDSERSACDTREGVLERIPARGYDVNRRTSGIGWERAAARGVIATGNHKARRLSAGIEDKIASVVASWGTDG